MTALPGPRRLATLEETFDQAGTAADEPLDPAVRRRMKAALGWGDDVENYDGIGLVEGLRRTINERQAEITRLRDALTESNQDNEILRGELEQARAGWAFVMEVTA